MKKISVIIPVYNAAKYLKICLDSILQQTYDNLEVLLVNDGSTDDSLAIAFSYAEQEERIVVIDQENQGASAARNQGLLHATGDYIGFVDADDWLEPGYFQGLSAGFVDDADLICCGYFDHSIHGTYVPVNDFLHAGTLQDRSVLTQTLLKGTAGVPWAKLFRLSIIREHNIRFHSDIKMSEDLIFNLEYAQYVRKAAIIPKYLYHYNRLNEQSLSAKIEESYIDSYVMVNGKLDALLRKTDMAEEERMQYLKQRMEAFLLRMCSDITKDEKLSLRQKKQRISNLLTHQAFQNLKPQNATWLFLKQLLQSKMQQLKAKAKNIWK
jgi:glycosyltransferase involved in cell wall biosynthesis